MTRIAFVGLGIMGSPMACNLARAGYEVVGFTRTPAKADALVAAGGEVAGSLLEAVHGADAVLTMLPDSPDVEAVLLGPGGAIENSAPGTYVIDMSTIRPAVSRRVAAAAEAHGLLPLDAPVSGGEHGAIEATLSVMAGGSAEAFEAALPILESIGRTIVHVGPAGAGQTVKAANQLVVAGIMQLVSEALVLVDAHGVDQHRAVEVLAGGLAGSAVLDRKSAAMLTGDFQPGFRINLHHKDLGIVLEAARERDVAVPLGAMAAVLMGAARAQGDGELDHSALIRGVQRMSGASV
ncbi:2-hydroxy-3-oxopropionate reductase [Dactylosporangium sp. NPDC051484]|uniref:2-hydroxy-3-oxopropionate reductase n=1 Tax=Dactylosporangium sp. NPDC051484 TaxID=3154942 RepID=UPI0034508B6B